jgi:TBC1 domain family protein 5
MPENLYFRQPDTQRMMLDILFVFCKLNPDLGYRQGMHELLAPMLWVIERDAVNLGHSSKAMGEDAVIRAVYDGDHIEHDAFALFGQVMQNAKNFYEQTTHAAGDNPMVLRSKRIVFESLSKVDPELASHLEELDLMPQVFLMRWIRLLFGREFPFDDLLTMWDVVFANDPSLEIVDHICLVMLLRIRWELMESDYNSALTLLLRYPPLPKEVAPQSLVLDALYLREHMHHEGGGYLVLKYTDRPLQPGDRPATPPALQRNITAFSGVNAARTALGRVGSPDSRPKQSRNIESIFQSAAKNIHARSEQLGIGKAVRNAVDEVHRKAQEISNAPTPSSSNTWRQSGPRTAYGAVLHKVKELENRNAQLSKLLEAAVGDLWEYQKVATEHGQPSKTGEGLPANASLEQLSVAIAKVQFVQVYLGDSSLPLPTENVVADDAQENEKLGEPASTPKELPVAEAQSQTYAAPVSAEPTLQPQPRFDLPQSQPKLADPSMFDDPDEDTTGIVFPPEPTTPIKLDPATKATLPPTIKLLKRETKDAEPEAQTPLTLPSPRAFRPPLAESPYSFMLGGDEGKDKPDTGSSPARKPSFFEDQRRNRGFLFGGDEDAAKVEEPPLKVVHKKGRAHRKNASSASKAAGEGVEVQDMQDMHDK